MLIPAVRVIWSFFQNTNLTAEELHKKLFALISCRSAIMDGEIIDSITAYELAEKVLLLENPRCPHGRPVVQTLDREQLYKIVRRII